MASRRRRWCVLRIHRDSDAGRRRVTSFLASSTVTVTRAREGRGQAAAAAPATRRDQAAAAQATTRACPGPAGVTRAVLPVSHSCRAVTESPAGAFAVRVTVDSTQAHCQCTVNFRVAGGESSSTCRNVTCDGGLGPFTAANGSHGHWHSHRVSAGLGPDGNSLRLSSRPGPGPGRPGGTLAAFICHSPRR